MVCGCVGVVVVVVGGAQGSPSLYSGNDAGTTLLRPTTTRTLFSPMDFRFWFCRRNRLTS